MVVMMMVMAMVGSGSVGMRMEVGRLVGVWQRREGRSWDSRERSMSSFV
jgi:hypothetical protein